MKKQYAVIGLGRFGYSVAKTLAEMDCEVIAIDNDEEKVKTLADLVTYAVVLDAMDDKALRSVGVQNVDGAIVSIGENIEASILVVMILKDLGVKFIIAKAVTQLHGRVLENLKVDRIVYPERDMAIRIAQSLIRPGIVEQLELSPDFSIVELPAPGILAGKTLRESQLRRNYGVSVIAIRRTEGEQGAEKERWILNPLATDAMSAGDLLVLIGKNEDLHKFSRL